MTRSILVRLGAKIDKMESVLMRIAALYFDPNHEIVTVMTTLPTAFFETLLRRLCHVSAGWFGLKI